MTAPLVADRPQPQPGAPIPPPGPVGPRPCYQPPCPTCGTPLPGLLALCRQPACIRAFLDDDALCTRWEDQ